MLSYHQENEVMERINDLIDRVRRIKNTRTAKLCFGVYYISERRDSVDKMSDYAKVAKNAIKGSAEGIISYFDDATKIRLLKEEEIEKTMYDALKKEEFVVYLQPKYRTLDESMYGAEALVRWVNEKGNIISPGYFIPIFEKNGFITELDNYMLRKVCEVFRRWLDSGYNPKPISVNISRIHFADPNLADNIKNIVDEYNIPHELIELELSESAFFENKHILIKTVVMMKKYGFLISMDDFGAGYSSLNSLKDIPLDVVKLDRELFYETDDLERGHTVIRNTISMAKDLNMLVVAEGIETKEQVEFLAEIGCDIIQGYYFAKPMPVAEFEDIYFKSKE
jgi:EAL domain-containing protein (putative c-di-GMP-specific phosphodiesterase class I)